MNKKSRGMVAGTMGSGSMVGGRQTMAMPMPKVGAKLCPDVTKAHNSGGLVTHGAMGGKSKY